MRSIRIKVSYFGAINDVAGGLEEEFTFAKSTSISALLSEIKTRHLELETAGLVVAVNKTVANRNIDLHDGDEVTIFPPMEGG